MTVARHSLAARTLQAKAGFAGKDDRIPADIHPPTGISFNHAPLISDRRLRPTFFTMLTALTIFTALLSAPLFTNLFTFARTDSRLPDELARFDTFLGDMN
jgi:hypothetical protein